MGPEHYRSLDAEEVGPGEWRHVHPHEHADPTLHKGFHSTGDSHPHDHLRQTVEGVPIDVDHHFVKFNLDRADNHDRDHRHTG